MDTPPTASGPSVGLVAVEPGRVRAWLRDRPDQADVVLAGVLMILGVLADVTASTTEVLDAVYREPSEVSILLAVVASAAVGFRRHAPAWAVTVAGVAAGIHGAATFTSPVPAAALIVCLYSVAAYGTRRESRQSICIAMVVVTVVLVSFWRELDWVNALSNYALIAVPWFLGDNLRNRRALEVALEDRARRAEQDRAEAADKAVSAERARIARELHDVVAHSMGVMVIQAGAARRVLRGAPDDAEDAVASIEATGREALAEMRRLVGVLRETAGLADRAPQPSLTRVEDLVAASVTPSLGVELAIEGTPRPLPPGLDLAAYRVIQEALTNAGRHAGRARAMVTVAYHHDHLAVSVVDDGRGAAADRSAEAPPGHGLVGMHERISIYGGTLRAGPSPGGGFEVRATLPLTATTAPARPSELTS